MSVPDAPSPTTARRLDVVNDPAETRKGIALMVGAVMLFAGIDASAKMAGHSVPKIEVVWFRFAVHAAFVGILLNPWRAPEAWRSRRPGLQLARALIQIVCTALNFSALGYLQLAQALSIQFLTPVFVTILSIFLLKERVDVRRWGAIAAGFAGVLIVTRPGIAQVHWAFALSLASVAIGANYNILTRKLALIDSPGSMLVIMAAVPTVLLLPVLPFVWVPPEGAAVWTALVAVGAFGAAGHYLMILAHRHAPASVLAPFQYLQLVATVSLGYTLFGDVPSGWTFLGAAVVIASGLYLLRHAPVRRRSSPPGQPDRLARAVLSATEEARQPQPARQIVGTE